jgi:SAM-dependent methyltransferase
MVLFDRYAELNFKAHIRPHLPAPSGARVLDLGCGFGRYLLALQSAGYEAWGVDTSPDQIEFARQHLGLSNCVCEDALRHVQSRPADYDAILLLDVLEHLPAADAVALCEAIGQALRPGGVLIIQAPNGLSPMSPHLHADITHQRAFTPESIDQVLRLSGFGAARHFATPPPVHGLKSLVRRMLWSGLISPLLAAYFLVATGSRWGGIYTPNLVSVAHRPMTHEVTA